ncbi:MAG: ClpXP protease specificity-enhancing factor [Pseudomonadota bacterium]
MTDDLLDELSRRPYLVRAMHEWLCDHAKTPHIVVDAEADGVEVPGEFVSGGRIILNISAAAAHGLNMTNEAIGFRARFNGVERHIVVPMPAVLGIYSRETGQGMVFVPDGLWPQGDDGDEGNDSVGDGANAGGESNAPSEQGARSHLKIIK